MRALGLFLVLATGCAAAIATTPGPGGSGVVRKHDRSSVFVKTGESGDYEYGYSYDVPGYVHIGGGGLGFIFGGKIGGAYGSFADRSSVAGIFGEPHADMVFVPRSDRWALSAGFGWIFQSLYYDKDTVWFNGATPNAAFYFALFRRLYLHAGAAYSFGHIGVTPDGGSETSASANELEALGGLSFIFRRTPRIDLIFRLEGSWFHTTSVDMPGNSGAMSGLGLTFETIIATF